MKALIADQRLGDRLECDSAGTIGYHVGNAPDSRMRKAGRLRGLDISGQARKLVHQDLIDFDLVLVMDGENLRDARALAQSDNEKNKIKRLLDFTTTHHGENVPDPYYGGEDGFHLVLDLVAEACKGVLESLCIESP